MQDKIVELMRNRVPDDGRHSWGLADLLGMQIIMDAVIAALLLALYPYRAVKGS